MAAELDVLLIAFLRVSFFSVICRDLPVAQELLCFCLLLSALVRLGLPPCFLRKCCPKCCPSSRFDQRPINFPKCAAASASRSSTGCT